jgi:hypothetical protein
VVFFDLRENPSEIFKFRNSDRGELSEHSQGPFRGGASNQWLAIAGGKEFIDTHSERNVPARLRMVVSGNPAQDSLVGRVRSAGYAYCIR